MLILHSSELSAADGGAQLERAERWQWTTAVIRRFANIARS